MSDDAVLSVSSDLLSLQRAFLPTRSLALHSSALPCSFLIYVHFHFQNWGISLAPPFLPTHKIHLNLSMLKCGSTVYRMDLSGVANLL